MDYMSEEHREVAVEWWEKWGNARNQQNSGKEGGEVHKEYGCDNFNCLCSDFADCDNGDSDFFGEECPHNESECELFNCCECCRNENTCPTYNG